LRSGFSIHGAGDVDDDYQMARQEGFEPPTLRSEVVSNADQHVSATSKIQRLGILASVLVRCDSNPCANTDGNKNRTTLQSNVNTPQSSAPYGSRCRVTSYALAYGFKSLALPLAISHSAFGEMDPGAPPPLSEFKSTWGRIDPR